MKDIFCQALYYNSIDDLRKVSKSDLHNHGGRGGSIEYIQTWANVRIQPPEKPFASLDQMQEWFELHVKTHCIGIQGYLKRIEAAFFQAQKDHIKVLSLSFGIGEIDAIGCMKLFSETVNALHQRYAPETKFYPELTIGRESNIDIVLARLDEIFSYAWFKSIDICNNEFAQPITNFKQIYKRAKEAGLRLKAHVGEFGSAEDVMEAVEELELNEVHHGIAAAHSTQIMRWLADHKIQLNICPTSNIMLNQVANYKYHPIKRLFDYGIPVTINTDDLLIFNKDISQEYLNLYNCNLMTVEELDIIRETGLNYSC